tara:strand:+ start:122 stop:274 length:153 start_codon:yes stop_codon:yes gene_type:complete
MEENVADLLYAVRNLCEALRDRPDFLDIEDEIREMVSDTEELIDQISDGE